MSEILCPYCGAVMLDDAYTWYCPECHSYSPVVIWEEKCQTMTEDEKKAYAREAALRRPLQKPMRLEEATGSEWTVWIEIKGWKYPQACDIWISEQLDGYAKVALIGRTKRAHVALEQYGKGWRCWASRPTNEERLAAKWEDANG